MSEDQGVTVGDEGDDNVMIDLGNVAEQSFEALPKGIYSVVIEDVQYARSKSSNQPMWSVTLNVTEGDFANRKLFTFISFSEKALPGTKRSLNRIAPELLTAAFNPKTVAESQTLVGRPCRVKVDTEVYQEVTRNRVKDFMTPTAGGDGFFTA